MPDGGELRLAVRAVDNSVVLEVADTGSGIADHDLGTIHDPTRSPELIAKPYTAETLLAAIDEHLKSSGARRQSR